jgi:hypothetical protein
MSITVTQTRTSTTIYPVTAIATVHTNATTTDFIVSTVMVPFKEPYLDVNTVFIFMGLMVLLLTAVLINTLRSAIRNARKKKQWDVPPSVSA